MDRKQWERLRYERYQELRYELENKWRGRDGQLSFRAVLGHLDAELPATLITEPKCPYCSWDGDNRGRHGHTWVVHGVLS